MKNDNHRSQGPSASELKNTPLDPNRKPDPVFHFTYVGKETQNLAGVGIVKKGDVIPVSADQAANLKKHAPEQFKPLVGQQLEQWLAAEKERIEKDRATATERLQKKADDAAEAARISTLAEGQA